MLAYWLRSWTCAELKYAISVPVSPVRAAPVGLPPLSQLLVPELKSSMLLVGAPGFIR